MADRERIRNNYKQGLTLSEKLKNSTNVTAGILDGYGKHCIGIYVCGEVADRKRRRIEKDRAVRQKTVDSRSAEIITGEDSTGWRYKQTSLR